MNLPHIVAVMIHVPNVEDALDWYGKAFPMARRKTAADVDFEFLALGNIQIEIVKADEKVSSGPSGTVAYWSVDNLAITLQHLESVGAKLYRGPMLIEHGIFMCQVQDPWKNCIGLRGPSP